MATTTDDGSAVQGGAALPVYLKNLAGLAAAIAAAGAGQDVDVASLPAGEIHLGEVGGSLATASVTLTRPADSTAYAAKDAVAATSPAVLSFNNMARANGESGYITKARLLTNQSTYATRMRLHLYHTAPSTLADNAPFTLLFANAANRIGYIDFDAASTEGTGSDAAQSLNTIIRLPFICAGGSRVLYGLLETLDIFTPASAQQFFIELTADQN